MKPKSIQYILNLYIYKFSSRSLGPINQPIFLLVSCKHFAFNVYVHHNISYKRVYIVSKLNHAQVSFISRVLSPKRLGFFSTISQSKYNKLE